MEKDHKSRTVGPEKVREKLLSYRPHWAGTIRSMEVSGEFDIGFDASNPGTVVLNVEKNGSVVASFDIDLAKLPIIDSKSDSTSTHNNNSSRSTLHVNGDALHVFVNEKIEKLHIPFQVDDLFNARLVCSEAAKTIGSGTMRAELCC